MTDTKGAVSPVLQILMTVITAGATVAVAYFGAVKPGAQSTVTDQLRQREEQVAQAVPVAINTGPIPNDSGYRLMVVGFCNATASTKQIEVLIGPSGEASKMKIIGSESGSDRLTVTCIVPRGWYYQVTYTPAGGGSCDVTAWKL